MATTKTVVPADPQHYVWWFPGSPVKVHLHLHVVRRLQDLLSTPRPGTAEEGLLFGRTREGATEILDFQPSADSSIPGMLAALPNDRKRSVVGYYRSEPGEPFHLTAKDLALAEECFAQPHHVLMMVHPNGFGPPNATFFFHDADGRMPEFAFLEFPLDSSLLAMEEHERMQRTSQAAAIDPPVELPQPAPVAQVATRDQRKRSRLPKVLGWVCFATLVLASGMLLSKSSFRDWRGLFKPAATSSLSPPASPPSMALHATRRDRDLELTWNRTAAPIAAAQSAVISIQDGDSKRLVPLDTAQLRDGSLLYSPVSDQILMQLTVKTPGDIVTESVMVILPQVGEPQTYPVAPKSASAAQSPKPLADLVPLVKASKPFTASPSEPAAPSAARPALQDPPDLKLNPTPAVAAPDLALAAPASPPQLPIKPPVQQQQQSQPSPALAENITYEPAVAIVKIAPVFPPELQHLGVKQTIQVKVTIDKNGKVVKAEAIPRKNVSQFLLNSAINAAFLWRFRPAMRNHVAQPSETTLAFEFNH